MDCGKKILKIFFIQIFFFKIFEIFGNFRKFRKIMIFSKCFQIFSIFSMIFYGFQNFLMFWKVEVQLFPKSIMSICEICSPSSLHGRLLENLGFKGKVPYMQWIWCPKKNNCWRRGTP